MLLAVLLMISGLVLTMVLGTPVALALARPKKWRMQKIMPYAKPHNWDAAPGFEPMVMDPLPMAWPSEVNTNIRWRPEPPWPSELWEDGFFGRGTGHKVDYPETAEEAEAAFDAEFFDDDKPNRRQNKAMEADRARRRRDVERQNERSEKQANRKTERQKREAAKKREEAKRHPQAKKKAKPKPQSSAGGPPGKAQLERMIADVGLAGTVQEIMNQTGWDFRKAAHYLAQARRG